MNLSKTKSNEGMYSQTGETIDFHKKNEYENEFLKEEDVFEEVDTSPLSHLLAIIGSLPEIRQEKVFHARDNMNHDLYETDGTLDTAIDKVLEELLSDS